MDQKTWNAMTPAQKEAACDNSGLQPQLIGWEGWRVEYEDEDGKKRRFIVGKSTGWRPCHLELHNIRSRGGSPARPHYNEFRLIEKVR